MRNLYRIESTLKAKGQTINSEKYIIFFLDSATRYLEFKLLKSKSEAYKAFIEFKN
jgi:extradiol dioxygenase family protein